jgi:phosphoglycerol transferase
MQTYLISSADRVSKPYLAAKEYRNQIDVLPQGCEILQLPYVPFPENPPVVDLSDYDHFLVSTVNPEYSWSYGQIKGTATARYLEDLSNAVVSGIRTHDFSKSFCAVHIDLRGYADSDEAKIIENLNLIFGEPLANSFDNKWILWKTN